MYSVVTLTLLLVFTVVSVSPAIRVPRQDWGFPARQFPSQGQGQGFPDQGQGFPGQGQGFPDQGFSQGRPTPAPGPDQSTAPAGGIIFSLPNCPCISTPEYNPACGSDGRTYGNRQKLDCARACGIAVTFVREGNCASRS